MNNVENILNISELDMNCKSEEYLITHINELRKSLINYYQISINFKYLMENLIKSFLKEIHSSESIPLSISKTIISNIRNLNNNLNDYDYKNNLFFEEVKDLYKKMKERINEFSYESNKAFPKNAKDLNKKMKEKKKEISIKLVDEKYIELKKENDRLKQKVLYFDKKIKNYKDSEEEEIFKLKAKNEELLRKIDEKNVIITKLKKEYLYSNNTEIINFISDGNNEIEEKKENTLLKNQLLEKKKELEELNKKLRKITNEDEQKTIILKRLGIEVLSGVEFKTNSESEKKEGWEEIINKYKKENQNLKDFIEVENQKNDFIMKKLVNEKEELEKKTKLLLKENNDLKNKFIELDNEYKKISNEGNINNICINNVINSKELNNLISNLIKEIKDFRSQTSSLSNMDINKIKISYNDKPKEEEYDKNKIAFLAKNKENMDNILIDCPKVYEISEKYKQTDFKYNKLKHLIREFIKTNNKIELCKFLENN